MKILILSDLNSVHTQKWVSGLEKKGCELMIFGLSKPTSDFYSIRKNVKISFANIAIQSTGSFSKLSYLKVVKKLKREYDIFNPDIVHAHYATSYGLLGVFLKHKIYCISVWGTDVYDFPTKSFLHKFILKRNLKKATHVFSTSHDMARETSKYTRKKIDVVPFGVDVSKFSPVKNISQADGFITIGIIKTLELVYGITYLIDAFEIIVSKYPKTKLLIVGGGSLRDKLEEKIKTNKIKNVTFQGRISHSLVPSFFAKMDIVVIPSLQESFGVAAVEASACEKPVIVSNVGGLPEVVIDGETGLICQPKDVSCIAESIERLIIDKEFRLKLGLMGRQNVLANYNWENNVDLMHKHYKSILF